MITQTYLVLKEELYHLEEVIDILSLEKTSNKYIKPFEDRLVQIKEWIEIEHKNNIL